MEDSIKHNHIIVKYLCDEPETEIAFKTRQEAIAYKRIMEAKNSGNKYIYFMYEYREN